MLVGCSTKVEECFFTEGCDKRVSSRNEIFGLAHRAGVADFAFGGGGV